MKETFVSLSRRVRRLFSPRGDHAGHMGAPLMRQRRKRERIWLITIFTLVVIFGFLEGWFFRFESDLPLISNILLFGLINLNVILLLLLVYLVLRSIVKLLFERKRDILGHKLRTRLVVAFVGLTLIPTLPLFWLATQFISFSVDYWFTQQVDQSLEQAVTLAKDYMEEEKRDFAFDCRMIGGEFAGLVASKEPSQIKSEQIIVPLLQKYHFNAVYFFKPGGELLWHYWQGETSQLNLNKVGRRLREALRNLSDVQTLTLSHQQEGLVSFIPLPGDRLPGSDTTGKMMVLRMLPPRITEKLSAISSGYENYLQLKLLHNPLKTSHFITFSIVTCLVIFAAIWFGFFLAKNITVPIQDLVVATQCIAEGDLEVQLKWERQDEIGMLVSSFNKMVHDLRESREQLASAYLALQQSHTELEDRRRYMEIVLRNIAAGVVSVDADGRITTINKSAEAMLDFKADQVIGVLYSQLLKPAHMDIVNSFFDLYRAGRQAYLEQQVQVMLDNRPMVLLIKVTVFKDEKDQCLGVVIVFDDLTDLEKAQRMAAWREVARRIAHEIKNPLTPIQLSAQRLRRKYVDFMESPEGAILEECTRTITRQVDLMKHLVNEFTNFARLPRANPVPSNLASIVEETLELYRQMYPDVSFSLVKDESFPILKLDRVQLKQVMSNLLDNAVHALNGKSKRVQVSLVYDSVLKIARLECADTGHGLPPEDKLRIFEPYYSTKEKGTGLGLAIVASIVADHNGFIRVRDNDPCGTIIIIELPG